MTQALNRKNVTPIERFQDDISLAGLWPPVTVIADGQSHGFETPLQGHTIRAWYWLSPDLSHGFFGISGLRITWRNEA